MAQASGTQKQWYDLNGNMITRTTYTLAYDAENSSIRAVGSVNAPFVYDGDGKLVTATTSGTTTFYVGNYYEKTGSTVRKYYYHGGRRVAMRENGVLSWLLTDQLGSTAMTLTASAGITGELRYKAYGETRYTYGSPSTKYRFTGQREESSTGLYFYSARWYDAVLGRFVQADTIVPEPGNPQALNRYSYVLNNPLRYSDSDGHCPWCYMIWRVGYEVSTLLIPGADRMRRDQVGGQLVTQMSDVINRQAVAQGVEPFLVSAILRHENAAFERRVLTPLPAMGPGLIADAAEAAQALIQGDLASIGPGQMQLRRAQELEQLGYVTARGSKWERIQALLGEETSVEYVTGMVSYLSDQLRTVSGFSDLSTEDQQRLLLIGYNQGWEYLRENIEELGITELIRRSNYDNQTLDEYLRWRAKH